LNLGEIKTRFWLLMGGNETAHPNITDDVVRTWANMAVREMAEETHCLQFRYQQELTAGTQEYDFPSTVETVFRVSYDGEKIHPTSKWDLMHLDDSWDTRQGIPRRYYVDGVNRKIGLWPTPSADTVMEGGEIASLELEYFANAHPAQLSGRQDEPSLPPWSHPGVVFYLLRQAYAMVGPQRDVRRAAFFGRRFMEVKERLRYRSHRRHPAKAMTIHRRDEVGKPWFAPPQYPEHIPDPEAS
jgi:hypothetical protein